MSAFLDRSAEAGTLVHDAEGRSRFTSPLHDARVAAILGIALGIGFIVCFITGVISHLVQDPGGWFSWPARPAGLYRFTQGLHVATGLALIPILFAKLWVVYPKLFNWPAFPSIAHALERIMLLPLIGGGLLLVVTGLSNINLWRPWDFPFRAGHYAAAWVAIGALIIHVAAKRLTTWQIVRGRADETVKGTGTVEAQSGPASALSTSGGLDRRGFLTTVFATSAAVTLFTVGQTYAPLRKLALLAPRRPDTGPQGFPVNRTAASVGLTGIDLSTWRLVIDGPGASRRVELTYDDLRAMPQREATLPIACVEGWSTSQRWRGVPLRDLLAQVGADDGTTATVVSMHRSRRQKTADVNADQAADADTLLALEVNGEVLEPDHGFPIRLIGPNRPGVDQTKWVEHIEVHS